MTKEEANLIVDKCNSTETGEHLKAIGCVVAMAVSFIAARKSESLVVKIAGCIMSGLCGYGYAIHEYEAGWFKGKADCTATIRDFFCKETE